MKLTTSKVSKSQIIYIETLADDFCFSIKQRNKNISNIVNRKITYLEQLYKDEADTVIARWKDNSF